MKYVALCLGAVGVALAATNAAAIGIDGRFQPYRAAGEVSGSFRSVSSDTLKGLMTVWTEDYEELHPDVRIAVESATSSEAAAALISGDADLAPMSRAMTSEEKMAFQSRHGYAPLEIRIGVEAVAIFVNMQNPVSCLSVGQIRSVFSGSAANWGDLGLSGDWAATPLAILGRDSGSDIAAYMNMTALADHGFRTAVKQEMLSSSIVHDIAADKSAIGYASAGYRIGGVKPVMVSGSGGCLAPNERNAYARTYPLAHFLYLYADRDPSTEKSRAVSDFLSYTLSLDGQQTVVDAGFFPPPYVYAGEDLGRLGAR